MVRRGMGNMEEADERLRMAPFFLETQEYKTKYESKTNTPAWDQPQTDNRTRFHVCSQPNVRLLYIKGELVDIDKIKDTGTTTPKYLQSGNCFAPDCGSFIQYSISTR